MSNFDIGNISGANIYTGLVSSTNPYDLYKIDLTHPGSLSGSLTGLSENADILLLDSQKNVVASSLLTGTTPDIFTVDNLTAGNYFVQVKSAGGQTPYQLKLSVDPLTGMGIESGYFTVGSSGQIGIDFLLDGGWYQGEVGIFRLDGMEAYGAGSPEFIKEAARRALTNSSEGYVIIKDEIEAAKFNASFGWENNYNSGNYEGIKTFKMNPGEKFAVMLVPNGTVENLFKNPNAQGDSLPLFSLATANPNDAFHIGQIADVTGDGRTFVMEDWRMDFGTDKDYNDVVFRVTGAKGYAIKLDDVIDPSKDWRTSDVGTQLRDYVNTAPQFLQFTTQASYQFGENINFSDAKVFDENGDLRKVEIWVKSAGEDWLKKGEITEFTTDIDGWTSFNYGLSDLAAGNYEVKAIAIDSLGQTSNEVIQNIEILGPVVAPVNTAPQYLEFAILPVINVGETVNLSNGKVLDAEGVSDLGKVEFWLQKDGGEWQVLDQKVTQFLANGTGWGTFDYSLRISDPGRYQIKGIAYDLAGNSSNEFVQGFEVKLPETAPTGLQFFTDKPIYNSGEAVNISGGKVYDVNGIGDLEKVVFSLQKDGGEWEVFKEVREFTSDLDGWGNFSLDLKKHWEAGSYQIKAIAYDKTGKFSEEVVRNFVVSAPIEMPANNAPDLLQFGLSQVYKVGDVVSLMGGKVYDGDGVNNLAKVDFLLKKDKGDWQDISDVMEFTPGAEGWANFSYQLADLGVGSYQLKAVAFDKSNAVSNSVIQSFEVVSGEVQVPVNSAPQFLQFGLNSFYTFGEQIGLTNGLIYDGEGTGDLEKIEFRLKKNQGNWENLEEAVIEFGDNGNGWGSFSYVLPFLEEGNYRLEGIGYDRAGGVSNTVVQSFTVLAADVNVPTRPVFNKGPVDLDFSILPVYTNAETISFNGGKVYDADGVQDVDRIDFWLQKPTGEWVDLADVKEFSVDNKDRNRFNYSYDLKGLNGGRYQLWAVAYDKVGNVSNVAAENFAVISDLEGTGLSDDVRLAMARSANLESYDKEALAQTREWVVWVAPGQSADDLAGRLGAINLGETGYIANSYVWAFAPDQTPEMVASQLAMVAGVEFAYPLVPRKLTPQFIPNDPLFPNQWHLLNNGETGGTIGADSNVTGAWDVTRGEGITIGIVDDGLDFNHPDLQGNYRQDLSRDFNQVMGPDGQIYPYYLQVTRPDGTIIWSQFFAGSPYDTNPAPDYKTVFLQSSQLGIRDNSSRNSVLDVPLTGVITDLNVLLDITHPRVSDLDVSLNIPTKRMFNPLIGKISTPPSKIRPGTDDNEQPVDLFSDINSNGANFTKTILDDQATTSIMTGTAPFTGRYQPESVLSRLNDFFASGNWSLTIRDDRQGPQFLSQLNGWGLEFSTYNPHGTPVAGVAAAVGNNLLGGSGIAPATSLAGLRLIADQATEKQIADALFYQNQNLDIYNNSWKVEDALDAPALGLLAMANSAKQGRNGLGNNFVFAGGNDGWLGGNVNYNGYANSRFVIPVAALDHNGEKTWYSEEGAALLVSAPSSSVNDDGALVGITTTDLTGDRGYDATDYTSRFSGTSSAAPVVSGVVALMLSANKNLSWRDVQHILVQTSRKNDENDSDWVQNGAGLWVNHKYGFGAIDATAAVNAALNWVPVSSESLVSSALQNVGDAIPDGDGTSLSSSINIQQNISVEKVEVVFDSGHLDWRDLTVKLISPDGTESVLAKAIPGDNRDANNPYVLDSNSNSWVFSSVRHWGESSVGEWKLEVLDEEGNSVQGNWDSWKLNLYGTKPTVTVSATDIQAFEGGTAGTFTFTRDGNTKYDLAVDYSLEGTAVNGADYGELTGNVIIPAGQQSVTVSLNAVDDLVYEGNETTVINVTANDNYNVGNNSSATLTIVENDLAPLPYVVTNTNDSGEGSLREILEIANSTPGKDTIQFNIPTNDPGYNPVTGGFTIRPLSALPAITDAVIIDGTTQPGFAGKPLIELDGSNAGNANGLTISAGNSTVSGMIINRFVGNGISLATNDGNIIKNNYIGTDITGTQNLGNSGYGVFISTSELNKIGGEATGEGNTIAFNLGGVEIQAGSTNNSILSNSIFSNTQLGIDIDGNNIVTANDVGDTNGLQNFPVLTSANTKDGTTTIVGSLNSTPNKTLRLEFFSNSIVDASGYGEGEKFLGFQNVTTDSNGNASFTINLTTPAMAGEFISATATDSNNNTSEFSQAIAVTGENIPVNNWNTKFINLTADNVTDRNAYDFSNPVAVMNLGEQNQGLSNGGIRLYQDWGALSPTDAVQNDNFAMQAWTRTNLEAGKLYKITTRSDDGTWFMLINVKTGELINNLVDAENGGYWIRGGFPDRTIFFKAPESGEYDFYVQLHEKTDSAKVDVTLEEAPNYYNFADGQEANNWKSAVYWWDRKLGNMPAADFYNNPENNVIGVIDQGSNTRSDGLKGISFNLADSFPLNTDINLPDDNFAIRSYTQTYLEAGVKYRARVRGDDGFQLAAKLANTEQWVYITPQNQWQQAYGDYQEIEFSVPTDGVYDMHFMHYEERGTGYLDLSWQSVSFSGNVIATIGANIRSGPGTNFAIVGQRQFGDPLTFDKWTEGEFISYPELGTASSRWYRIAGTDQWISGAIVNGGP